MSHPALQLALDGLATTSTSTPVKSTADDEREVSSPLSSPPSSVLSSPLSSPPPSLSPPPDMPPLPARAYPSPPSSQQTSHSGSPIGNHGMDSQPATDTDGPPPAKRRRISREPKERSTQHLDLRTGNIKNDHQQDQLDRVMRVLHKRQKIVVIAGAGMSVSAGIPDFRSSTGLFKSLKEEHKLKGSGKHLFDASVYKDDSSTSSFHTMVSSMSRMTKDAKPTIFHHMLATIASEDRLLRLYSQNVDGIDTGLEPLKTQVPLRKNDDGKWPRTIQLHGGLDKMVCSKCGELSDFDAALFSGPVPPTCPECEKVNDIRTNMEGKRSHGIGRLRPRMVLYNEHNPDDEAIGSVTRDDLRRRPDAVIVVGTTLKVPGVRRIVREMCGVVRDRRDGVAIWINNDLPPVAKDLENCFDIIVQGGCDEVATRAAMRKWNEPREVDDFSEVSDEVAKKASAVTAEVHVPAKTPKADYVHAYLVDLPSSRHLNNSFPPPSSSPESPSTPRKVLNKGPEPSPFTSHKGSIMLSTEGPAETTDQAAGLLTPSKSQKSAPSIFSGKPKAAASIPKKATPATSKAKTKTAKPQPKKAITKGPGKKKQTKPDGLPQSMLSSFSVTKGISATGKKDFNKNIPSAPQTPSKLRHTFTMESEAAPIAKLNVSPLKTAVFPNLSQDKEDVTPTTA